MIQEISKQDLASRDIIRENSKRGDEAIKIPLAKVRIREGFNVRQEYGDIESLANSILENSQIVPARVDAMADGTFILTDGHRRFEALKLLESQGHEPFLIAFVNANRTTEEQRILQMFLTQDNKPLTPLEVCELIKRLINLGHDVASVAKKIGKSTTYVSNMLSVADERPEVKKLIESGQIGISTAIAAVKEIPNETQRVERLTTAANSGKKVTTEGVIQKKAKKYEAVANRLVDVLELDPEKKQLILDALNDLL
jgi:ParB/RepB/Spo0J family partition protein